MLWVLMGMLLIVDNDCDGEVSADVVMGREGESLGRWLLEMECGQIDKNGES